MKQYALLILLGTAMVGCRITYFNGYPAEMVAYTRGKNVCKELTDSIVVYPIFVDVEEFHPWTEYDINSTMDSIRESMAWLEKQAKNNAMPLKINVKQHLQRSKLSFNESKATPSKLKLNLGSLGSSKKRLMGNVDAWADKIAKYAAKSIKNSSEALVGTKNKVTNVERLIARLRNIYNTDNVALLFMVNGYYENYPSLSLHTDSDGSKTEYSIVTNKNPAIIAHEVLHLFGAVDLYSGSGYNFNYKEIQEIYPNEIMRIQHKQINALMLSPITKYYIGWQNNLSKEDTRLLYHKHNVLEY